MAKKRASTRGTKQQMLIRAGILVMDTDPPCDSDDDVEAALCMLEPAEIKSLIKILKKVVNAGTYAVGPICTDRLPIQVQATKLDDFGPPDCTDTPALRKKASARKTKRRK